MGIAKQDYLDDWTWRAEAEERSFAAGYEAAQSKLRLACLCREISGVGLDARIVSLVLAVRRCSEPRPPWSTRRVEKTRVEI